MTRLRRPIFTRSHRANFRVRVKRSCRLTKEVIFGEKFIQETTNRIYHLKRGASFHQAGRLAARGRV